MEKILIFGSGGHAKVLIDIAEKQGIYIPSGILTADPNVKSLYNYPVLGIDENIAKIQIHKGIIAVGDNQLRKKIQQKILEKIPNFKFVVLVHPSANIGKNVTIHDGVVIMAGANINSDTIVNEHAIVNTNASIDHDCTIGAFSSLAPGCTLGGNVTIESNVLIGLGASVIDNVKIGTNTIIGAGSTVVSDIPSNIVAYGTPCKPIRSNP